MLDPKLIRESPDLVRAAIAKKHLKVDLDAVLGADAEWRAQLQEVERLRAVQKAAKKPPREKLGYQGQNHALRFLMRSMRRSVEWPGSSGMRTTLLPATVEASSA